jgi:hypothetical protein
VLKSSSIPSIANQGRSPHHGPGLGQIGGTRPARR